MSRISKNSSDADSVKIAAARSREKDKKTQRAKKGGNEVENKLFPSSSTSPGNTAAAAEEEEEEEDKLVARLDSFNEYAEAATRLQRLMSDGFLNLMLCRR